MTGLDTLIHQIVALNFGITSGMVILLGLVVSWWIVGHWWKQNKYISELLKSSINNFIPNKAFHGDGSCQVLKT